MNRSTSLSVAAALSTLLALGCSGSSVTIATLAVGSPQCPYGGQQITQSGKTPINVCAGPDGGIPPVYQTLVNQVPLAAGDTHCPNGGVELESGLDNGSGGGVANDGILQPGEVTSTEYVCNGSTNGATPGSVTPPPGSPGSNVLTANGGTTTITGNGGAAGNLTIEMAYGSNGGNVMVFATGSADAGFTLPAAPAGDFGSNPVNISGTVTIAVQASATPALALGTPFVYAGVLYTLGASGGVPATGLSVAASSIVTFQPAAGATGMSVSVPGSCHNLGTIQTSVTTTSPAVITSLGMSCGDFYGAPGSAIDLHGLNGTAGMTGGTLQIQINNGSFWNEGSIVTSGGSGAPGGTAGAVYLSGYNFSYNTGTITAAGGSAAAGSSGGAGNVVRLSTTWGSLYNRGAINTTGAKGFVAGGWGGGIVLSSGETLINTAGLTSSGGSVDSTCPSGCTGGTAGGINLYAVTGALTNTGTLTARGGDNSAGQGTSGGGSSILLQIAEAPSKVGNYVMPDQNLIVDASMDTSGGNGAQGGNAGGITIQQTNNTYAPNGEQVILYGVSQISAKGGLGGGGLSTGGNGGTVGIYNSYGVVDATTNYVGGGNVVNYAAIDVSGGDNSGASFVGGSGGGVTLQTNNKYFAPDVPERVINAGNITANGGCASAYCGSGGSLSFYGRDGASNTGKLSLMGGSNAASSSFGGACGSASFEADNGPLLMGGSLNVSAGSATSTGGSCTVSPTLSLIGGTGTTLTGQLAANGGSGNGAGFGGNAGNIVIYAQTGVTTITGETAADISVLPGGGGTPGTAGSVRIDGQLVTSAWTH
jgi:hypothetical protein